MFFEELKLINFKNYASVHFELHPKINLIYGLNGMGKTNVLDALHFLCMARSYFTKNDFFTLRRGSEFFRLEALAEKGIKKYKLSAKYIPWQKKEIELNGKTYERLMDHIGAFPVVFSAPKDIQLITGPSADRRALLDRVLCQLDHDYMLNLALYKNLLKHRNAVLKDQENSGSTVKEELISSYSVRMERPSAYIFEVRSRFIEELELALCKRYKEISKGKEELGLKYESQLSEYPINVWFDKNREKDLITRRTNAGIHKDDLSFFLDDQAAKNFASQGQLKSLLLSLKLGLYDLLYQKKQEKPVLLLDDIFAKLDHTRIEELIRLIITGNIGQVFITDTESERIDKILEKLQISYRKFEIQNGSILKQIDIEQDK